MRTKTAACRLAFPAWLVSAFVSALVTAPVPAAAQDRLPPAGDLVAKYVQAIGGRDAVLRPKSSRATGHFEMPGAGLKGDVEVLSADKRVLTTVTLPGLGTVRSGYNGQVGWSIDPMMGARLLTGGELDAMRDQADPLATLRDDSLVKSKETVERSEIDGRSCYKVRLVWTSGRQTYDCYDTATGLLVATIGTQESPMGAIEVTTVMSEYRDFGGVKMPMRLTQSAMGQQQVMTVTDIQFDTVPAGAFELPAEIKALLKK